MTNAPAPVPLHSAPLPPIRGTVRLAHMLDAPSNSFAMIRIAMALAVLVSHAFFLLTGTTAAEPLTAWTGHSLGEHAVQVFFFLSGILVAQSFARSRSALDFVTARGLRIFPGLAVCVLLTAYVLGPLVTGREAGDYLAAPETLSYVLRTLTLSTGSAPLPGVFESLPASGLVNMSLWTLKYELLCYAGLFVLGLAGLFNPQFKTAASVLLALAVALVFIEPAKAIETYTPIDNMRYFAVFFGLGALAYLVREHLAVHGATVLATGLVFWVALGTPVGELATAVFLGASTLYVARFTFGPLRAFANRYDLSYGVYVYACPVQQFLIERFPEAGPLVHIVLALAIVVPLAMLSWVLIERPALRSRPAVVRAIERVLPRAIRPRAAQAPMASSPATPAH